MDGADTSWEAYHSLTPGNVSKIQRLFVKAERLCDRPARDPDKRREALKKARKSICESLSQPGTGAGVPTTSLKGERFSWGIFEDQVTPINTQIESDHKVIERGYDTIERSRRPSARAEARDQLETEIRVHGQYERDIYCPFVGSELHDDQVIAIARDHERYVNLPGATLHDIKNDIVQHMRSEEAYIIPAARAKLQIDPVSERLLSVQYSQLKHVHKRLADVIDVAIKKLPPPLTDSIRISSHISPCVTVSSGSVQIDISPLRDGLSVFFRLHLLSDCVSYILSSMSKEGIDATIVLSDTEAHAVLASSPSQTHFMLQTHDFDPSHAGGAFSFMGAIATPYAQMPRKLLDIGARAVTINVLRALAEQANGTRGRRASGVELMEAVKRAADWDVSGTIDVGRGMQSIYDALCPGEQEEKTSFEQAFIAHVVKQQESDQRAAGRAFRERLLPGLSEGIAQFGRLLEMKADQDVFEHLIKEKDVIEGGERARQLAKSGLTPVMIAQACHAIAMLLRRLCRSKLEKGAAVVLGEKSPRKEGVVPQQGLIDEVVMALEIPQDTADALVTWLLNVAQERPFIFDGFRSVICGDTITVREDDTHTSSVFDLWAPAIPDAAQCSRS